MSLPAVTTWQPIAPVHVSFNCRCVVVPALGYYAHVVSQFTGRAVISVPENGHVRAAVDADRIDLVKHALEMNRHLGVYVEVVPFTEYEALTVRGVVTETKP